MPATYAHWHFGDECIKTMPEQFQKIVNKYRSLYDLGVHGPDILFYDLKNNEISSYGSAMHKKPAKEFFALAKDILKKSKENNDAKLAYILGFLTHFTFDSSAHTYVEKKRRTANISHNKVESDYERHLVVLDGYNPNFFNRSKSLKPTKFNSEIIANFFPFDSKQIRNALVYQKLIVQTMTTRTHLKRKALVKILTNLEKFDYIDLLMDEEEYPICRDSNLRLDKYKKIALIAYPKLLNNLIDFFDDKNKLNKYFDKAFDVGPEYDLVPILPYEEELLYKVEPHNI